MKHKNELVAVIDWIQITFQNAHCEDIIYNVLQFRPDFMTYEDRGRFRYVGKWYFGHIELLTPPEDYPDMGYHIYLTGGACREMEIYLTTQKRSWFDFFEACREFGGKCTRLDIAIDDRNTYFKIRKLGKKIERLEFCSRSRNWQFINGGTSSGDSAGCTLNLGSRASDCSMVFYEKNHEQAKKTGLPVTFYGAWNRYEVRLRHEMADNCIKKMIERKDIRFIGMSVINYYIRFVVPDLKVKRRDYWKVWEPWRQFMEDMGKLKLSVRPAARTLEQKKKWIEDFVAPTLKMIKMADDSLADDFLKRIIEGAVLQDKHRKIVDDYLSDMDEIKKQNAIRKPLLEDMVELKKHGFENIEQNPVATPFDLK